MTTNPSGGSSGLPLTGTSFLRFAIEVIDLLIKAEPHGLDQDALLQAYFKGKASISPADRDAWWEEFKRARDYSNDQFNKGSTYWGFIRAQPGPRQGQYFYHLVAQRDADRVKIRGDAASMARLDDFTDRRWLTQTKSRQQVKAAHGLAMIEAGMRKGDQALIDRGQDILDRFVTLSPGLAAVNFGSGIAIDDLIVLAASTDPHIRLLNRPIRDALRSGHRFQRDLGQVTHGVLALANIYSKGSMKSLP